MNSTKPEYDLRDFLKLDKKFLTVVGAYPQRTWKGFIYCLFVASIAWTLSILQLISVIIKLLIDHNDLIRTAEVLQYFILLATFLIKLSNLIIYRKQILEIEDFLTTPILYKHSQQTLKLLENRINSCKRVVLVFRVLCGAAVLFYALTPYLSANKELSLSGWLPYNTSQHYYLTYTFQILATANTAYTNSSIDTFTWMLITLASGQFEILKENLKNINFKNQDFGKLIEEFNNCVKHHKEITSLVIKIQHVFSIGIFIQFFSSITVICFTEFVMIFVQTQTVGLLLNITVLISRYPLEPCNFFYLTMYLSCMTCQIAMYCWYGHDVMTTSDGISESFYMSNWYESNIKIRRNMIIFLERIKKPVTISAAGMITLSLTTLTTILRSSYSYFAVLRRLYDDS